MAAGQQGHGTRTTCGRQESLRSMPGSSPEQPLAEGPVLYFNQVPKPKRTKNRIHLCLCPETLREQEVERLLGLGATLAADRRNPDGSGRAVLADPEGSVCCRPITA